MGKSTKNRGGSNNGDDEREKLMTMTRKKDWVMLIRRIHK